MVVVVVPSVKSDPLALLNETVGCTLGTSTFTVTLVARILGLGDDAESCRERLNRFMREIVHVGDPVERRRTRSR